MKPSIVEMAGQRQNTFKRMKRKLCILTLVGIGAWSLAAFAQDNPPAGELPAKPTSTTPASDATAADQATAEKPAATPDKPAADSPQVAANTPAADPAAQPATPDKPAAADAAAPPAAADATAPAAAAQGGVIPLIVMDDVPLTDAIKNLARQAGLNYMLDPKVAFGQPGPDGRPAPQPTVSIRWENVTAEQALNSLLGNYNLQMVEDPKSKIARVTVRDPAAPDPLVTKVIQLKYASATNMSAAVQSTLSDRRSKVVPDVRTSQLVVLATEKELVDVDQLVERLDTPTKQVLIEAKLLETQVNPSTLKGVDWGPTLKNQNVTFGNNEANLPFGSLLTMSPSTGPFFNPVTTFLNADGVRLVLSFLNNYAETKVISTPRTVTLDNEPAKIEVGTLFPIVNTTAGTANTTGGSQVSYSNLTVRLEVTPRISANNNVNLKVKPTVMRLGDLVKSVVGDQNNAVYSFNTREITTSVMIPSGDTLVMGGLIEDNIHQENVKVPVLGDIPGLGYLFRHDSKSRTKANLLVFLTPTIVQDEDFQPTKTDFLKTPVPTKDVFEGDWSAWDSGKPRDWSKPDSKPSDEPAKFSDLPNTTK
jgi:type IV pilus assembly protein PilQ